MRIFFKPKKRLDLIDVINNKIKIQRVINKKKYRNIGLKFIKMSKRYGIYTK